MNPTEPVNRGPHGDPHRESDLADNQWLALRLQDDDLRPALMKRAEAWTCPKIGNPVHAASNSSCA